MELADCADPSCVDGLLDNVALVELVHTALFLCGVILSMQNSLPSAPSSEELSKQNESIVPPALYNFLCLVLSGDMGASVASADFLGKRQPASNIAIHRHVNSLAQDMIHCATRGHIRTPKHFALPLTVQH